MNPTNMRGEAFIKININYQMSYLVSFAVMILFSCFTNEVLDEPLVLTFGRAIDQTKFHSNSNDPFVCS